MRVGIDMLDTVGLVHAPSVVKLLDLLFSRKR